MAVDQGARDEIMLIVGTLPALATALETVAKGGAVRDEKILGLIESVTDTYGKALIALSERLDAVEGELLARRTGESFRAGRVSE